MSEKQVYLCGVLALCLIALFAPLWTGVCILLGAVVLYLFILWN